MSEAVAKNVSAVRPGTKAGVQKKSFLNLGEPSVKLLSKKEQLHMFRGLASMLRAQINTADAVKYYGQGLPNKGLAKDLLNIHRDINAGVSVHEAFRKTKRFDDMAVGLIQAGSESGQLHNAFSSLAKRLKIDISFQKAIKKATVMPVIVISVLIGAFITAQVKIVTQVEQMLTDVGQEPDGMTAIAFKVSHFTQNTWMFAVPLMITIILVIAFVNKVRNTVLILAMSKLRVLRLLVMGLRQATFLGTMDLLYSNGINLAKAIRVSANSVKKTPFYHELRTAADKYEHTGVPLSTAFGKYTSADDQVVHMLAIGERSASLDVQLKLLSEMLEEDTENYMSDFTNILNFVVLIIAVALIAAVFIGTFLPIFLMGPKMMQSGL